MLARDGSGHFGKLNKQLWRGVDSWMISNIQGEIPTSLENIHSEQMGLKLILSICLVCSHVLSTVC